MSCSNCGSVTHCDCIQKLQSELSALRSENARLAQMSPKLEQWERAQSREAGARSAFEVASINEYGEVHPEYTTNMMTAWRKREKVEG